MKGFAMGFDDNVYRVMKKYVRDAKSLSFRIGDMGDPYALLVVEYNTTDLNDNTVRIGWSRCRRDSDNFSKRRAHEIAMGRLNTSCIELTIEDTRLDDGQVELLEAHGFNREMINTLEGMTARMYLNKHHPKTMVGVGNSWAN